MFRHFFEELGSFLIELFRKEEFWVILFIAGVGGALIILPLLRLDWIIYLILKIWWLWVFLIIFPIFESLWLFWRQAIFKKDTKFILLEIRVPREVTQTPQAMEQLLRSIHSLRNAPGDIREKYWDGEVTRWFALEMVSFGGEVRFFIRTYGKYRNLVEAAFFSYYPDVEIMLVDDYTEKFPKDIPEMSERGLEIWGTEMLLKTKEAFPIKTYPNFEEETVGDRKINLDPISVFLEVLGKIKKEEIVGIQILIAPAAPDWAKKFESVMQELQEPETMELSGGDEETGGREIPIPRTPGKTDILEAVEQNLTKPAFDSIIRFIYLSPKEIFYDSFARRGLVGAFNQYAATNLNSFRSNYHTATRTQIWNWPHIFPKSRNIFRKQRLLHNYLRRELPPETAMGRIITSYLLNWNNGCWQ